MLVIANPKRPVPRAEGAPGKAKRQGGRGGSMHQTGAFGKAERTGLQNESERSLTRKGRKDGGFEAHQKGARCTKKVRSGWAAGRAVQGGDGGVPGTFRPAVSRGTHGVRAYTAEEARGTGAVGLVSAHIPWNTRRTGASEGGLVFRERSGVPWNMPVEQPSVPWCGAQQNVDGTP